ncbi:DUF4142 domain-containing protein [Sphingobium nicotianae]|uniref:DUF4142 domain-containing protein n=1 Tax=Sphingobium nicotianae TaxID=2782607 RepID=A0A9X1DDN5_9SPHN|nr:DUF4142 domain-containing protein [Sphingobium nicotianae]MBT2187989.1 DUF4142 domain-containing protein [Sphingobium nicotianae]
MKKLPLLAALASFAIAAPLYAATTAATYVAKAGGGDLYETQSSKLVLTTTKDAKVRAFADRMIADHAVSTAKVKAAAAKSKLTVAAPKLDAAQNAMMAELKAATGPARDKLYLQQQHKAHEMALALHQDYANSGDKPALKSAAAEIVPVVKQHIASMPM